MHSKRPLENVDDGVSVPKRARLNSPQLSKTRTSGPILDPMPAFAVGDNLSSLSDELLLRILSFLSTSNLLEIAPVSRRFYRLSADSQLWRTLYYHRFVLPRALRIPGFRRGSSEQGTRIHHSARRAVWAGGGWCRRATSGKTVNWKQQYKLRYNWTRGKATVEELEVGGTPSNTSKPRTLAKVIDGIAVTADGMSGLRAWDLKTRETIAQAGLADGTDKCTPTCLAIDEQTLEAKTLDISVGFFDGSFGIWRLHLEDGRLLRRYRNAKSPEGQLIGIAYHHPFVLTATESILISLYSFEKRRETSVVGCATETEAGSDSTTPQNTESEMEDALPRKTRSKTNGNSASTRSVIALPAPVLMTSLKSHTSQAPLALSIREMASFSIASIAYTYASPGGWSIGIQDLQIRRQGNSSSCSSEVVCSRLALTASPSTSSPFHVNSRYREAQPTSSSDGPKTLCYNHPYLLAALADNTLILHVCTSNATKLSVSPGIRLWGHTSGISDAEITARGKAVSVSCRGEEIRVWELEGRVSGKSTEIRPNPIPETAAWSEAKVAQWDERRNWVGFDDEMVTVLKETKDGRETLVVYDFS